MHERAPTTPGAWHSAQRTSISSASSALVAAPERAALREEDAFEQVWDELQEKHSTGERGNDQQEDESAEHRDRREENTRGTATACA